MNQVYNDYVKDLEHLTSTLAGKIHEGVQKTDSFFSAACICRVPEHLRKLKESAYTPKLIAIGPLHHKDDHLQTPLQHVKMSYTNALLSRVTAGMDPELAKPENFKLLKECLAEMKTLIDKAKKCYAAEVTVDEEMMLVVGCFILEYLYRRLWGRPSSWGSPEKGHKTGDPICGNRLIVGGGARINVNYDLLLIENQIPYFVLQKLFQLTVARIPNRPQENWLLSDYVMRHYQYIIGQSEGSSNNRIHDMYCYHILHKIHDAYMLPSDQTNEFFLEEVLMPSASELVYAGVKFVPAAKKNLLKVKFTEPNGLFWWYHRAHFEIPQLEIYDQTETRIRNLVALEQCCPYVSQHISSYVDLMDMLVNSDTDVQVLEKAGVIKNHLGSSQDATDLFNKLTKGITVPDPFEACKKADQYSKRFWPRNMAHLRRTYFSSPWTFITVCVGFIAFVITFVQFVRDFLRKTG